MMTRSIPMNLMLKPAHIEIIEPEEQINVFPNPNEGEFEIVFELSKQQMTRLEILDMQGRLVKSANYAGLTGQNSLEISLKNIQRGHYILRLTCDDFTKTKTLLVN